MSLAKEKETTNRESKDIQGQYFFSQQRKILVSLSVTFVLAIIVSFAFDLELKNMMTNKEIYCENSEKLVYFFLCY